MFKAKRMDFSTQLGKEQRFVDRFPASGMGELSYGILFSGFRHPTYKAGISAGTSGDHHQAARKRNHTGGCAWTTVVKGLDPGSGGLVRLQLQEPHFVI